MRHNVKGRKLNRNASHRRALMRNMATNLFRYGSIETTLAKAKETRPYAEKLITKAISGTLANKRIIFEVLNDRAVAHHLISDIAPALEGRKGGYLRIIKVGPRHGDGAEMAIIEIVGEEFKKSKKHPSSTKSKATKDKAAPKDEAKKEGEEVEPSVPQEHEKKSHSRVEQAKEHLSFGSKAQGTRRSSKSAKPKQAVIDKSTSHAKTPPPSSQKS